MTCNSERKGKKSVVLELVSDKQLAELRNSSELLFTGKVAAKSEGGFKKLYDLPSPTLLDRCTLRYTTMTDVLSLRIKHHSWLCDRDSGWSKHMCTLFANQGLLFIYTKPSKGYVLKPSYALQLELYCGRKKILPTDKPADSCNLKLKYGFGSVEVKLMKNQVDKWRVPLIKAFDAKLPCFETTQESLPAKELEKDACIPLCNVATPTSSESKSVSVTSLFDAETSPEMEAMTIASTASIASMASTALSSLSTSPSRPSSPLSTTQDFKSPKSVFITSQIQEPGNDSTFIMPVYRLETEREKPSRREPPTRIAEKIAYFEGLRAEVDSKEAGKFS